MPEPWASGSGVVNLSGPVLVGEAADWSVVWGGTCVRTAPSPGCVPQLAAPRAKQAARAIKADGRTSVRRKRPRGYGSSQVSASWHRLRAYGRWQNTCQPTSAQAASSRNLPNQHCRNQRTTAPMPGRRRGPAAMVAASQMTRAAAMAIQTESPRTTPVTAPAFPAGVAAREADHCVRARCRPASRWSGFERGLR